MTQLGGAVSPRRSGSEFETIFSAWGNDSQMFNEIPSGTVQSTVSGKERHRHFGGGGRWGGITRQQHVCKRFEDCREQWIPCSGLQEQEHHPWGTAHSYFPFLASLVVLHAVCKSATFSCRWRQSGENPGKSQKVGHQKAQSVRRCWENWVCSFQKSKD